MYGDQLLDLWCLMANPIKIGTRGSKLAFWQANWVKSALETVHAATRIELVSIKTKGDKILDVPLAKVGGKGLFVKEIEEALMDGRIDMAVHSMKDMPSEIPPELCIGAIPERETPKDVLISKNGLSLFELPSGALIGTASLRRAAQIRHLRPDIIVLPLRGNLDTRLKKLESENLDAIVLAAAGVRRLHFEDRITQYLDEHQMIPAVGQGALCIEIRASDEKVHGLIATLEHPPTRTVVSGERAFLTRLGGGCQVPVAAYGRLDQSGFVLTGLVSNIEGTQILQETLTGPKSSPESIGIKLAERLLSMGADKILADIYQNTAEGK